MAKLLNVLAPHLPLSPSSSLSLSVSASDYGSFCAFAAAKSSKQWASNFIEKVKVIIICASLWHKNKCHVLSNITSISYRMFLSCFGCKILSVINFSNQPFTYLVNSIIVYSLVPALGQWLGIRLALMLNWTIQLSRRGLNQKQTACNLS